MTIRGNAATSPAIH